MTSVVISQPMFFPWVGLFEQCRLADIYVHYDDVQFPQGRSFMNRVQIKHPDGTQWLTAPTRHQGQQLIRDVLFDDTQPWRDKHLKTLSHVYARAPFAEEMLTLAERLYRQDTSRLSEFNQAGIEAILDYFSMSPRCVVSSELNVDQNSSEKLVEIMKKLAGTRYVTGHGAQHYLNHELFEAEKMTVEYMLYECIPYPQLQGEFTAYVSILDLIANAGKAGESVICSKSIAWQKFIGKQDFMKRKTLSEGT